MTDLPQTAPDELMVGMADALNAERWGSKHDAIGRHDRHGFYAPCGICRGAVDEILALLAPVVKAREAEIERQVRDQVAAEARFAASQVGRHPDFDWDVRTLQWFADRLGDAR